jgi:signal transduction histidine kinase
MRIIHLIALLEKRWKLWLLAGAVWTAFGIISAFATYQVFAQMGIPRRFLADLIWNLVFYYKWGLASPLIFYQARRFPLERGQALRNLIVHSLLFVAFHLIAAPVSATIYWYLAKAAGALKPGSVLSVRIAHDLRDTYDWQMGFLIYCALLAVGLGKDYYRKYREGELKAAVLISQLTQAQLQALKTQLQPHFLFNTLNSISALLHQDVQAADAMVARLGAFLRLTLENSHTQMTTLRRELDFLRRYLDIERARFRDRLMVEVRVEPETLNAMAPSLILQPLAENAIRHGISKQFAPGHISLRAGRRQRRLWIELADNGAGLSSENGAGGRIKEGIGISNTRARLEQLYGSDYLLEFRNATPHGLVVRLEIPLSCKHEVIESADERDDDAVREFSHQNIDRG